MCIYIMNSINLYEGINLVCFNKEDTISKTLDSIKEKVTTISSYFNAANVCWVLYISITPSVSWSHTIDESPPYITSPQVTTDPSSLNATNALSVLYISITSNPMKKIHGKST